MIFATFLFSLFDLSALAAFAFDLVAARLGSIDFSALLDSVAAVFVEAFAFLALDLVAVLLGSVATAVVGAFPVLALDLVAVLLGSPETVFLVLESLESLDCFAVGFSLFVLADDAVVAA